MSMVIATRPDSDSRVAPATVVKLLRGVLSLLLLRGGDRREDWAVQAGAGSNPQRAESQEEEEEEEEEEGEDLHLSHFTATTVCGCTKQRENEIEMREEEEEKEGGGGGGRRRKEGVKDFLPSLSTAAAGDVFTPTSVVGPVIYDR
ncbi:unnamed protein product [Pleuronectes platessa]|uniref:Uncharacterized protein n=1 Tax=Pleuronectes platessa TaxID=8262 RepID=A0A9N7YYG4_PLEPL|nr:unnamed protein product [Pleuronectes platessa]